MNEAPNLHKDLKKVENESPATFTIDEVEHAATMNLCKDNSPKVDGGLHTIDFVPENKGEVLNLAKPNKSWDTAGATGGNPNTDGNARS